MRLSKKYLFRAFTNVLLDDNLVPLSIALDRDQMDGFLAEKLL